MDVHSLDCGTLLPALLYHGQLGLLGSQRASVPHHQGKTTRREPSPNVPLLRPLEPGILLRQQKVRN